MFCVCVHMYKCMYVCMCVCVCMYVCMCVYVCMVCNDVVCMKYMGILHGILDYIAYRQCLYKERVHFQTS